MTTVGKFELDEETGMEFGELFHRKIISRIDVMQGLLGDLFGKLWHPSGSGQARRVWRDSEGQRQLRIGSTKRDLGAFTHTSRSDSFRRFAATESQ